jgi:hypothetical protein
MDPADRIWEQGGMRREAQPTLSVEKAKETALFLQTVSPTHANPSQVIPFPLVLSGDDFTGLMKRMENASSPDHSTSSLIWRYEGAGYPQSPHCRATHALRQCSDPSIVAERPSSRNYPEACLRPRTSADREMKD